MQAASSSSHPAPSCSHVPQSAITPDLKREWVCGKLEAALGRHNSELQSCFPGGAPLELLRSAKLCIELAKQQASSHLKVGLPPPQDVNQHWSLTVCRETPIKHLQASLMDTLCALACSLH
jgi:hypothetical protein